MLMIKFILLLVSLLVILSDIEYFVFFEYLNNIGNRLIIDLKLDVPAGIMTFRYFISINFLNCEIRIYKDKIMFSNFNTRPMCVIYLDVLNDNDVYCKILKFLVDNR